MKRVMLTLGILAFLAQSSSADYRGWGVHEGRLGQSAGVTRIEAQTSSDYRYHWDKSDWNTQIGQKVYISTDEFLGMTIENALQSISYDVVDGNWVNVYWNIVVEDTNGGRAVISPAKNSQTSSGFIPGTPTLDYSILVADQNWIGPVGEGVANWNDIKDLIIAMGPAPELPDTLSGSATGQGDPRYQVENWKDWAEDSGIESAFLDGFMIVFGQSTGTKMMEERTVIDNLLINGASIHIFSRPQGSTYAAKDITETSARLYGGIVHDGGAECSIRYHYWREDDPANKMTTDWECCHWRSDTLGVIVDLRPGTTYQYVLEVMNDFGDDLRWYAARTFTTLGDPLPEELLVGHYAFAGNALDSSGMENHGVIFGDPNWIVDMIGGVARTAIALDGIQDGVQLPRSISLDWTMALWMRTDDPGRMGLGGPGNFWNGYGLINGEIPGFADDFGLAFQSYSLSYGVGAVGDPGTTLVAQNVIFDTEWHHVAATRDAYTGHLALFLDGEPAMNLVPDPNNPNDVIEVPVEGMGPVGPKEAPQSLLVGSINGDPGKYLFGEVADTRLYNYVLDVNEIAALVGLLEVKPMENLVAISDPGTGLPLTALALDWEPTATLVLGATTFAGPPMHAQFPPENADNFNLDAPASADDQAFMRTVFPVAVRTVFLLERGANDTGYIQALDAAGEPVGSKVAFSPDDFFDTGYSFLNQKGGGLRIDARTPVFGIVIYPPDDGPLGVDPVSISGIAVLP
jgi:hypothetical protein